MINPSSPRARTILSIAVIFTVVSSCKMDSQVTTPMSTNMMTPSFDGISLPTETRTPIVVIDRGELQLSDFDFLEYGIGYDEIIKRVGPADKDIGSGYYIFEYKLADGTMVYLPCTVRDKVIILAGAYYYLPNGNFGYLVEPQP